MKALFWALAVLAAAVVLGVVVGSDARAPGAVTAAGIQVFGTVAAICFAIYVLWNRHNIDVQVARREQKFDRRQLDIPAVPVGAAAPHSTYVFEKIDPAAAPPPPPPRMATPVAPPAAAAPVAEPAINEPAIIEIDPAEARQREERLARLEAAAHAATYAVKLIDEAWAGVGDNSVSAMAYAGADFSREKFAKARAALHEIHVVQLPDSEIARPIEELRSHVFRAASLVEGISRAEREGRAREEDAGRISLAGIREQSHGHTAAIEAAVTRMRDAVD